MEKKLFSLVNVLKYVLLWQILVDNINTFQVKTKPSEKKSGSKKKWSNYPLKPSELLIEWTKNFAVKTIRMRTKFSTIWVNFIFWVYNFNILYQN